MRAKTYSRERRNGKATRENPSGGGLLKWGLIAGLSWLGYETFIKPKTAVPATPATKALPPRSSPL